MAKKMFVICLVMLALSVFSNARAADADSGAAAQGSGAVIDTTDMRYNKTPLSKLQRGVANIATCYLEVPASIFNLAEEKGDLLGFTLGSVQGLFTTLFRALEGVFDTVTFIIPPYNRPIMQPEFATQSLEEAYEKYENRSLE